MDEFLVYPIGGSRVITLNKNPKALGLLSLSEAYDSKDIKDFIKKVGDYGNRFL